MRKTWLHEFIRETRSTSSVELAIIAPVLFSFLFGIILMGVGQFWQMALDDSVRNASRQVEIGTVTTGAGFVTAVCNEFGAAENSCSGDLQYSVQGAATFSAITPAKLNTAGLLSNASTFAGVGNSDPLLIQVAFVLPINVPLIPQALMTMNGTKAILSAVAGVAEP